MRSFEIVEGSKRKTAPCAVLEWNAEKGSGTIRIANWATPEDLPFALALILEKGSRSVDAEQTRRWIEERVVPSGRQNLGQVLKAHGLDSYDPLALLIAAEGRCSQDDFFIRETGCHTDEDMPAIGPLLKDTRKQTGYTQQELAKRAGVQQSLISRLENDESNPTIGLLSDIARALRKRLVIGFE